MTATNRGADRRTATSDRWVRRPADVSTQRALRSITRAGIYEHLQDVAQARTVRDIAERFDVHPNVARTHLETLADAGLVVVGSRKHPGGGRPAKVYLARSEAAADELHVDAAMGDGGHATLLRVLGNAIVSSGAPSTGRLEAVRQSAISAGARLAEHGVATDDPPITMAGAAEAAVRVLRADGHRLTIVDAGDDQVVVSRISGAVDALRPLRGGLASAVEWGLLTGTLTTIWQAVQVSPVTDDDSAGWVVRPASSSAAANRLLVSVAGRVDARTAPRETGVVRAMRAITGLEPGAVLEVLAGGPGSPAAFARWADRAGHELIGVERASDDRGRGAIRLLIRKGRS